MTVQLSLLGSFSAYPFSEAIAVIRFRFFIFVSVKPAGKVYKCCPNYFVVKFTFIKSGLFSIKSFVINYLTNMTCSANFRVF